MPASGPVPRRLVSAHGRRPASAAPLLARVVVTVGSPDGRAHVFRVDLAQRAMSTGVPAQALCGVRYVPVREDLAAPRCGDCEAVLAALVGHGVAADAGVAP